MASLEDLNMQNCTNVVCLPESFCRLSNLKKFNLSCNIWGQTMKLKSLPEGFGQLGSLKELNLQHCESLRELPAGIPAEILPLTPLLFG